MGFISGHATSVALYRITEQSTIIYYLSNKCRSNAQGAIDSDSLSVHPL